jgi:glycerate kinase
LKIVLAPDSYKGSLTAKEACSAMEKGIRKIFPQAVIVKVPMADGGEGTLQSLIDATNGHIFEHAVLNPLGRPIKAKYGIMGDGDTAVIEMAEASGLNLIPKEQQNPLYTTTYGVGELITAALNCGCRKFIVGLGGSGTNDGGAGMVQALGGRLLDAQGKELPFGGGSLSQLKRIDLSGMDERLQWCTFTLASDVDNPLCGPDGASRVYGPQKGASPKTVQQLDANLAHYADIINLHLGIDVAVIHGGGAAGGLGAGMIAFLNASLRPGVELIIEAVGLEEELKGADLVLTGEGKCDFQTIRGKTPYGVAQIAQKWKVPVVIIAGSVGIGVEALYAYGVQSVFSMVDRPMSLEQAITQAPELLMNATERIMRLTSITEIRS